MKKGKIDFSGLLSPKEWKIVTIFFAVILLAFLSAYLIPASSPNQKDIRFVIQNGETLGSITKRLHSAGIIRSETLFKFFAYASGNARSLQAGRYTLGNSNSYYSLISRFGSGEGDKLLKVELYGGISNAGIFNRLKGLNLLTDDSLLLLTEDRNFLRSLEFEQKNLLGYLLPGGVSVFANSSSREVLEALHNNFNSFINDSLRKAVSASGYSLHQIITLASIVDAETNRREEMKTVAGVYLNRLKSGMKLQADPTVQFLLPEGWRRLTYRDLQIDSPYNTYKNYGIPPGPINNPGKDAILSVIYPEKHKYLFFVSDSTGKHNFSTNFNDHSRLAKKFHIWLNSRN